MNENETPTLDPAEFDLDSWLVGGTEHRPTRSVKIYRDLNLNAEAQAAIDRLEAYDKAAPRPTDKEGNVEEELGGDTERDKLEARVAELFERMKSTTATVTVHGLTNPETKKISEKHDTNSPAFEYAVLAKAGRLQGRELTMTQWQALQSTIGPGQWQRIVTAYQAATLQVPDVDAPFSRKSSRKVTGD